MFPYIKLTFIDGGKIWVHHKTIAQVYFDMDDETTTISTTTEDHDFSVQESVEFVVQKLKAFYPADVNPVEEDINKLIDASYLDLL